MYIGNNRVYFVTASYVDVRFKSFVSSHFKHQNVHHRACGIGNECIQGKQIFMELQT